MSSNLRQSGIFAKNSLRQENPASDAKGANDHELIRKDQKIPASRFVLSALSAVKISFPHSRLAPLGQRLQGISKTKTRSGREGIHFVVIPSLARNAFPLHP